MPVAQTARRNSDRDAVAHTSRRNGDRDAGWRDTRKPAKQKGACVCVAAVPQVIRGARPHTDRKPKFGSTFTASWPVEKNLKNLMKNLRVPLKKLITYRHVLQLKVF